jgi:hypothetical protein
VTFVCDCRLGSSTTTTNSSATTQQATEASKKRRKRGAKKKSSNTQQQQQGNKQSAVNSKQQADTDSSSSDDDDDDDEMLLAPQIVKFTTQPMYKQGSDRASSSVSTGAAPSDVSGVYTLKGARAPTSAAAVGGSAPEIPKAVLFDYQSNHMGTLCVDVLVYARRLFVGCCRLAMIDRTLYTCLYDCSNRIRAIFGVPSNRME